MYGKTDQFIYNFGRCIFIFLCSVFLLACTFDQQSLPMPEQTAEQLEYSPPAAETWTMENGLQIMFIEDPELPLISGVLYTRQGSLSLPVDQQALAAATGTLMRSAGAGDLTARQLDQKIKDLSAVISSSISGENGAFGFSGLASDREQIFKLLSKVVRQPRFQTDRVELWKAQSLDAIKRRVEDPDTIAGISFSQLLYGDSIYGRVTVSSDVSQINSAGLKEVHELLVRPDRAILAVTGAIERSELERLVTANFADWQARGKKLPTPPEVNFKPKPGIYLIERPLEQTTIQMGQLGIKRLSPDHMTAVIFNHILSAGMTGRLMAKLRVELGLAYSTYGSIFPGVERGTNMISIQTKAQSTVTAIEQAINVITTIQQVPVTADELRDANLSLNNSFVFKFVDPSALVNRYALLDLLNYPADYDLTYRQKIAKVSAEQVQEAAQRLWQPNDFIIVVVGNEEACRLVETAAKPDSNSVLAGTRVTRARFTESLEF